MASCLCSSLPRSQALLGNASVAPLLRLSVVQPAGSRASVRAFPSSASPSPFSLCPFPFSLCPFPFSLSLSRLLLEHAVGRWLALDRGEAAVFWSAGRRRGNGLANGRHAAGGVLVGEDQRGRLAVPRPASLGPRFITMNIGHVGQAPVHSFALAGVEPF